MNFNQTHGTLHTPHFSHDIGLLASNASEEIILDDLNAKHSAQQTTQRVRHYKTSWTYPNIYCTVHAPAALTHFPHSGTTPSTIDVLITNTTCQIDNIYALDTAISDHCPVLCKLKITANRVINKSLRYNLADWEKFRVCIEESDFIPSTETGPDIDTSIDVLSNIILHARDTSIPSIIHRDRFNKIAPDTWHAIKYKNKLNRLWQRSTDDATRARLKTAVNIVSNLIGDLVRRDRNARCTKFLEKMDENPKKLWKVSRSLRGKRGAIPTTLAHENSKLTTNDEKAEALATVFGKSHLETGDLTHPHDAKVARFTGRFSRDDPSLDFPRIK